MSADITGSIVLLHGCVKWLGHPFVSLPSLAVSAIPSLPSPGAVGALPDATVSLSTPMERSTGRGGETHVNIIHSLYRVTFGVGFWGGVIGKMAAHEKNTPFYSPVVKLPQR